MAVVSVSRFAETLEGQDHETLVEFVAALWEGSGWETTTSDAVVTASSAAETRRLLVLPSVRLPRLRGAPEVDGEIDYVVTPRQHDDGDSLPRGTPSVPVISAAELRERLLYSVDQETGERLCAAFLDIPLRDDQWKREPNPVSGRSLLLVAVVGLGVVLAMGAGFLVADGPTPDPLSEGTDTLSEDGQPEAVEIDTPDPAEDEEATAETRPITTPTVYVGGLDDTLYALETATGEMRWEYTAPEDGIGSSPTVVNGTLYVGTGDTVDAIDAETGAKEWSFTGATGPFFASPTVADRNASVESASGGPASTVYIPSYTGTLSAIDATTGETVWQFANGTGLFVNAPTVSGGTVYAGDDRALYALDARSGERLWTFETPKDGVVSSPTVQTVSRGNRTLDLVYAAVGGTLYALDAETGDLEWTFDNVSTALTGSSPTAASEAGTVVRNATVFTVSDGAPGTLSALDPATGEPEWTVEIADEWTTAPTVSFGTVFAGTANGTVQAIDADTGERLWSATEPDAGVYTVPAAIGSKVFVGTDNGTLYAFSPETGKMLWRAGISERWIRSSPTVVLEPATGHSVDSRVLRGTLGHHENVWTFGPLAKRYLDN